jgi:general secretion pathway protein J
MMIIRVVNQIKSATLSGFTLLELLVALAIFAMVAVIAYGGLATMLTLHQQTSKGAQQLAQVQMTFMWLKRDIEQAIHRPIRDNYGDVQPPLQGNQSILALTRTGWQNPAQQQRSQLQRVTYQIKDNTLWRSYWWVLDRAQDTQSRQVALLNHVETLQLRFLDETLHWHDEWPPAHTTKETAENLVKLKAINIILTIDNLGTINRLFVTTLIGADKPLDDDNPVEKEKLVYLW